MEVIFLLLQASIYILSTKSSEARGYANMADRKSGSFSFKVPPGTSLSEIQSAIENEITETAIKVFEEIRAYEYLIELTDATQVQELACETTTRQVN